MCFWHMVPCGKSSNVYDPLLFATVGSAKIPHSIPLKSARFSHDFRPIQVHSQIQVQSLEKDENFRCIYHVSARNRYAAVSANHVAENLVGLCDPYATYLDTAKICPTIMSIFHSTFFSPSKSPILKKEQLLVCRQVPHVVHIRSSWKHRTNAGGGGTAYQQRPTVA